MSETITKKLNLRLVGVDDNAFSLLGAFRKQAKKENWTNDEIDVVMKEAMSGDYNHLLHTLAKHCKNGGF